MDHACKCLAGIVRSDDCCSDSEEQLDRSATYWGRGRFRGNRGDVGAQKMDTARVKPHVEGNPHGEPQPRAAPRPQLEDLDGYVLEVYDEGLD